MVTRQVYDFSDYTDLIRDQCGGADSGRWQLNDNPAQIDTAQVGSPSAIYSTTINSVITDETKHNYYVRMRTNDIATAQPIFGIYFTDGLVILNFGYRDAFTRLFSGTIPNRCDNASRDDANASLTYVVNEWLWFKIYYDQAIGKFEFSYNNSNSTTKPSDWTRVPGLDITQAFGDLTEFGCFGYSESSTPQIQADDLEVEVANTGSGNTGLDAAIEIKHTYARLATGGQGAVRYELSSPRDVDTATIQGEIGNQVSIQNANEIDIFKGEIKSYSNIDPHGKMLEGVSQGNKLTKLRANTNALTSGTTGLLKYAFGSVIYDRSKAFSVNEFQNKPIVFTKGSGIKGIKESVLRDYYQFPEATPNVIFLLNDGTPFTPDTIVSSDPTNLYFFVSDGTANDSDNGVVAVETTDKRFGIQMIYDNYFRTGTSWTKILLFVIVKFESTALGFADYPASGDDNPEIRIYNYDLNVWENLFDFDNYNPAKGFPHRGNFHVEGGGWSSNTPAWHLENIDILKHIRGGAGSGTFADYFDIGAENNAGYKKHEMKIAVYNTSWGFTTMGVYGAQLYFQTTTDQFSEYGVENIASNTANTITLDNANLAGVQMPTLDGFSSRDTYYISDYVVNLFADVITNSGTSLLGDIDCTDADEVVDINDMTYTYVFDVLQRWATLLNAVWWVDPRDNTIYFRSVDKIVDSGVTLTEADIIDFDPGAYSHTITGSNIRNEVVVVGARGLFKPVNTSPEFALDGGDEQEIYVDANLQTQNLVERYANKKKIVHQKANREVRLTLNYTKPQQDYSALFIGKWVKVNIASQVEADYISETISATDGKLLIIAMDYNKGKDITGDMDYMTFSLQRRYSA